MEPKSTCKYHIKKYELKIRLKEKKNIHYYAYIRLP